MEGETEGEREDPSRGHHSKMDGGLEECEGKPLENKGNPNIKRGGAIEKQQGP